MSNPSIRESVFEAIPLQTASYGETPRPAQIYLPSAHAKALRWESNLVVGARGVGKSFWTAALEDSQTREIIDAEIGDLRNVRTSVGYGLAPKMDWYPEENTFSELRQKELDPFLIWRGVIYRWVKRILGEPVGDQSWEETVTWCGNHSEEFARLVESANLKLSSNGEKGLLVFDSLDRTSNEWEQMDDNLKGLLRVVLWLKSFQSLSAKVFLREDQFDRAIASFPDASKLLATKAELIWQPHDLHGLLWQHLCNAPKSHGERLRDVWRSVAGELPLVKDGIWRLDRKGKPDEPNLRKLFEKLAGPWMGKDRRRGVPYVWAVGHLCDGNKRTSPRSFLAAIRAAAEESIEMYSEYEHPLHYESIKRGVQSASQIRIDELAEDYPWVRKLCEPLRGKNVPCDFNLFEDQWKSSFPNGLQQTNGNRLPPQHASKGWGGIREDLERLGIFEILQDERINMPDLYRVGFGLGRKGGVRPIKK